MNISTTSLVLRVCRPDGTSYGGFQWPLKVGAEVIAPDWINNDVCGNGLHGWLHGQGVYDCVYYWRDQEAKWLVLEVETDGIVMLGGKCKFERCVVRFVGELSEAAAYIVEHEPKAAGAAVIGASKKVGDGASAIVGVLGTAIVGSEGTAIAGERGKATAGSFSSATVGRCGTASVGDYGIVSVGEYGMAAAGRKSEMRIQYFDAKSDRYRTAIAYVGENGIKPYTTYKLDNNHQFVEANK